MNNTELVAQIERLKKEKNAIIMAHYYTRPEVQDIADFVGDSLALAQVAAKTDADIILFAGVNFMAETAKVLCPQKKVLIPAPEASCSLADSCPAEEFEKFVKQYPDHIVVSYVNTSSIAIKIDRYKDGLLKLIDAHSARCGRLLFCDMLMYIDCLAYLCYASDLMTESQILQNYASWAKFVVDKRKSSILCSTRWGAVSFIGSENERDLKSCL